MGETLKQKQPFSVWYVRELENYLSDMVKEGKRFIGRNRFEKCENKQITYRIMHGPAELDQALLDELQAQNWFYAGDINKIGNPKTCFHAFETEDVDAPDSMFLEALASTAKSLTKINLEFLIDILVFSAIVMVPTSIYWRSFFFLALPSMSVGSVFFFGYLLISSIVWSWNNYAAKNYLKEMVDRFGPAYPAKEWRKLKEELRMKQRALSAVLAVVYVAIYFAGKTLWS